MLARLRFARLVIAALRWLPPPGLRRGVSLDPESLGVAVCLGRRECDCHATVPISHLPVGVVGKALDLAAAEFGVRSMCGEGHPLRSIQARGWDGA